MKRIVSYLLAAVLILTPCVSSYATEPGDPGIGQESSDLSGADDQKTGDIHMEDSGVNGQQTTVNQSDAKEGQSDAAGGQPVSGDNTDPHQTGEEDQQNDKNDQDGDEDTKEVKGQVDVYIAQTLDWEKPVTFTVTLEGQSKTVTLPADNSQKVQEGVTFEDLPAGTYNLRISAPGFADHTQQIEVEDWAYKLSFATGFLGGYGEYTAGGKHPGVLLIGDVDGNKMISEEDEKLLIDLIDEGGKTVGHETADLNQDGRIDLMDLEYFVQGYKVSQDISSMVEINVPASAISLTAGDQTTVDGELKDLLKGEGSVTLTRADTKEITENTPVTVDFEIPQGERFPTGGIVIDSGEENPVRTASVDITYMEGTDDHTITVPVTAEGIEPLLTAEQVTVTDDGHGKILINLGSQIAVKKVSLKITGMQKNNNLAEISRVEFVNDMENRIPEPQRDIPEELSAQAGNKSFVLNWKACMNITGYEVQIEDEDGRQEVVYAKGNRLAVSSFMQDKLVNGKEYKVRVQSVNGAWRSGYCEPVTVVPKVDKAPDAPDNVRAEGRYRAVYVSWKKMEDTDSYYVYYRESGTVEYIKTEGITANNYTITGLEDKTAYEVYVIGVNDMGESKPSLTAKAETIDQNPAQMPKYKLINRAGEGEVSEHIISASIAAGSMNDSPLDSEAGTAWGTVDNDPASHYAFNSWDGGGFNALGNHGVTYEFDQTYKMDRIALQEVTAQSQHYGYVQVRYWDENGNAYTLDKNKVGIQRKTDSENRAYYLIRFPEPIEAKKIQFGLARTYVYGTISMSEVYFYHYDTIEEDIMALYEDDLHMVLRDGVTQETIDDLRKRINTPDEVSGEYHPDKDYLERELKTAEDILNSELTESVSIYNTITTKDVGRGFSGLNAWQPLGVTAAAGEEITVYVGHNTKKTGETTNLQLISTQYHSDSAAVSKVVSTLKIGRNDITVPKLWSTDAESGGALYVQYTGSNANDYYAVRVSGGVQVPRLDLYRTEDGSKRQEKAENYLAELDEYIKTLKTKHEEVHKNSDNKLVQYDYYAQDCILGASDIMLDTMMLSLPAQQIYSGVGTGSIQERAGRLVASMDAIENMMGLFYQHKGLNNTAPEVKDRIPANHLNIRYQRMFAGAFMYASGNHIGIEWNETAGMMSGTTVQADESGRYISGRYFGWGIAHEIGHCINQGTYAIAEITNNYYSVLAQAKDTNDSVRFKYENVYEKVTSNTTGRASNVFTQLGMYWQLHLAYDNGLNYKTYPDYNEQLESLFFARVDTYARTPANAPAPGGVALTISGDKDQDLIRLSCAAAQKNILEFFERWGMIPNEDTINYAKQFPAETRAICYVNDDSRVYRLSHGGSALGTEGNIEAVGDDTEAAVNKDAANKVDITLTSKNIDENDILGYEIVRCTTSNGEVDREVVGFTTEDHFTDVITTMNNRVVTYEITVIDQYLNRSAVRALPELKIRHEGELDKTYWTVRTKDISATNAADTWNGTDDDPCTPEAEAPITEVVDNKTDTIYTGIAGANAEVIIEFNQLVTVSGFRYTAGDGNPIKDYSIYVKNDADGSWIEAAAGMFESADERTVYFGREGSTNIALYQTTAMKLAIKNQEKTEIAISELDVLGVTGDNVEFRHAENGGSTAIGRLENAYQYGKNEQDVIPAGSIVFTGSYKGNSAYNVVILYDQDGNIVGGMDEEGDLNAYQVVFSDVPEEGNIEDTYDGTWIYWIDPKDVKLEGLKKVRAELYRVDNALDNTGQRLVSDTVFETMPETLPNILLSGREQ